MSLIRCAECGCRVSTKAALCPTCGAPTATERKPKITVEATGKKFKAMLLGGIAVLALSLFVGIREAAIGKESTFGGLLFVAGFLMVAGGLIAGWWQHG